MYLHSSRAESWFLIALLYVLLIFKSAKEIVFLVSDPRPGVPSSGLNPLLPVKIPQALDIPLLFWSWPDCFSSLPTRLCVNVSLHLDSMSLSASLQFVFSENYSTCKYIFDLFMGGGSGELHFLLLCHLDLFVKFFLTRFNNNKTLFFDSPLLTM